MPFDATFEEPVEQQEQEFQAHEKTPQDPQKPGELLDTENIPQDVKDALKDLMFLGERESDFARRGHYREMLESEEFWKGNQYPIWSDKDFSFRTPWDFALANNSIDDQPTYQYVINIYQSMGLTVIAALSQKVPKVRFFPHSTRSEVDIATARAASDVAELIEKNNKLKLMAMREAYLLWTQGGFGTYTRFVRDKNKGWEEVPVIEMSQVTLAPDRFACQACGYEVPADLAPATSIADDMGMESETRSCPECGAELTDADFLVGESTEVPVVSGVKQVPEGYEKMSVYGFLNLKMMPYVQTFDQTGYIQLVEDVHESALRAAYFSMHREIGNNNADQSNSNSSSSEGDTYERQGRMRLFNAPQPYGGGSAPTSSYLTYRRCWLRRWYLMGHPDPDMREKLYNLFPNGAYVAFAGDKFLEARNEDMDDHWTICTAMPSYGIYGQSIGASTIPLQKQINDAGNIVAEHLDFGTAPPVFYDAEFVSGDALKNQKMRPGTFHPIVRRRGAMARNISELMYQPTIKIDTNIYGYGRSLIDIVQVVSGALPSLFGGQLKGNDTLGAYEQSRDQALGKLQLFWASVKQHHADTMRLGVECFRKNRTGDAEKVILGKSNDFSSKYIRLSDLRGNIVAEPEADEDFPASWNEIRGNLNAMMQTSPEMVMTMFNEPANLAIFKKYLGSPAITFSAEANREKQFRENDELLASAPIAVPDPMGTMLDPVLGIPVKYLPTVMPIVHGEDHVTHIKSIMEWVVDPEGGILAQKENPEGFANVMAHLLAHKEAMAQVAAFDMQLSAQFGLAPVPGEEGDTEGESGPPGETKDKAPKEKNAPVNA